MERAFAATPALRRPRPDADRLRPPVPALDSIVTAPPILGGAVSGGSASAV
jgi:hypothetical protein